MATLGQYAAGLMKHMCEHNSSHGYTQGSGRWGDGGTEQVTVYDRTFTINTGDRDCSSAVISAWDTVLRAIKGIETQNCTYTGNMIQGFLGTGFFEKWDTRSTVAVAGDVYLNVSQHTAMCITADPDMLGEFSINEHGTITGGRVGDQTGKEAYVHAYYDFPWDCTLHCTDQTDYGTGQAETTKPATTSSIPKVKYRVRVNGQWLAEMTNHKDKTSSDNYAGILGKPIQYIAINMPGWYQVKTTASGWLPKVYSYNVSDLENGCAGDGSNITAIRCYYETKDPSSTGWLGIEYQAHTRGGSWLAKMHDLTDTGGSSDDYAGNGAAIDGFRAKIIKL